MKEPDQIISAFDDTQEVALIAGDRISTDTSEFFEPVLEPFTTPFFVAPQITPRLVETAIQERLLVLNGSQTLHKPALSRHVAWLVGQTLEQQGAISPESMPILEWYPGTSPQNPAALLLHWPYAAIFILPQVMPHHLHYDLLHLQQVATLRKHYIILLTDVPFVRWQLPDTAREFWHDLSTEVTYRPNDLADVLMQRLHEAYISLPTAPGHATRDAVLVGRETIRTVAVRLKTPTHIAIFTRLLAAEQQTLSEQELLELIALVRDDKRVLQRWYLKLLTPREQLFALGLSLFEGLFDDQLFAALEELVNTAWHHRDVSLRALDYCDLEGLHLFFNPVKTRDARMKVESILPEQRRLLLEIAWDYYRRQILAVLPVLEQLVTTASRTTQGTDGTSQHWNLYGTPARRDQLYRVVGETLSDIGLISTLAVQDTLIRLIADAHSIPQTVAARTMARWYGSGRSTELVEIFRRWQHEQRVLDLLLTTIQQHELQANDAAARAYLRAAIALIVGYAAQYDLPGSLSRELVNGFARAAEDTHPLVRSRFRDETLPLAVPLHLVELRSVLRDITAHIDLHTAIAQSLAQTYEHHPEAVLMVLDEWYDECVRHRPRQIKRRVITLREALLVVIVRTYGELRYATHSRTFSAEDAFRRLEAVLFEERHPFVRRIVFVALHRLLRSHFAEIETHFQQLVAAIPPREHGKIVTLLTEIYLEQRQKQPGGDGFVEVGGCRYPVWVSTTRPLTTIEQTIYRWIKSADNSAAQDMAVMASVAFVRALEQDELRHIGQIRRQRRNETAEIEAAATAAAAAAAAEISDTTLVDVAAVPRHSLPSAYVEKFVPWFVTIDAKQYRPIIRGLLDEALAQSTSSREALVFVLSKWNRTSDDEMRNIAQRLERALSLIEGGFIPLLIVGAIVLFVLFYLMSALWRLLF